MRNFLIASLLAVATAAFAQQPPATSTDARLAAMGWSREQVVEFMRKSHAVDEPTIQAETDRYIDEILGGGALPLDLLDERITRWISKQSN